MSFGFFLMVTLNGLPTFFNMCYENLEMFKSMYIHISNRYPNLPNLSNCNICWFIMYLAIVLFYVSLVLLILYAFIMDLK
jgi:hypothetical protein